MHSDPLQATAVELVRAIASRKLGVTELLEASLLAIARLNPRLNAFVTVAEEQARASAKALQEKLDRGGAVGLLHGLPLGIKDVTLTAGIRTTYGSPLYRDHVPTEDAEAVARLKRAGAIILGKTNTPEFATGANTVNELFGATRNPWNTDLSPAGSSGGSAVAVAAGMVPLAQGTDFGCSIRIPAAFCGIVGIRTTAGLIPNRPMHLLWDPGQVHGPLARTAEDAALMLDAMIGLDPLWPISVAPPWNSALAEVEACRDGRGLRIAYAPDIAGFGVDAEVEEICRKAANDLRETGASVVEIDFDASDGIAAYKTLRGQWMLGQQLERMAMLEKFGPNLRGNLEAGLALSVGDTAAAEHVREKVWASFCEMFGHYDFLLTPAAPVLPYPLTENFPAEVGGRVLTNYIDWIAPAFLVTLVGFPAGSVPAGKSRSGLPVGLQIVGPRFSEPGILSLAKLVQIQHPIGRPPILN
jgi:amidase